MQPGRIGDEYFLTRGHIHATGNRPEIYYGEAGQGLMLMESPEGETRIIEIQTKGHVLRAPVLDPQSNQRRPRRIGDDVYVSRAIQGRTTA